MIKYSSYSVAEEITLTGIGYHFSDVHICTIRDNKQLVFDETNFILKLSLDNGLTYSNTLDLSGVCTIITRSKIYANGNVLWADHTKCYYSTDNLVTYHESTVIDIAGDPFVPATYDNFKCICYHKDVIINGEQIDVWGAYSIETDTQYANMNVWYTIDSGITIKSCFKYGVTCDGQMFRHVHSVDYCDIDGSFWMRVGDGYDIMPDATQNSNNFWNHGFYDWETDIWTWTQKYGFGSNLFGMGVSVINYNEYIYWGSERQTEQGGVWRMLYSDLLIHSPIDTDYSTQMYSEPTYGTISIYKDNNVLIANDYLLKNMHISLDYGTTWTKYELTGGPDLDAGLGFYLCCNGPDQLGYYRFEIMADGEVYRDFTKGIVLMLRVK